MHRLENRDFYAADSEDIHSGDFDSHYRVDFFAIIWFLSDSGHYKIDFEDKPVKKNLIYILAKNQVYTLIGKRPKARVILFSNDFFDRLNEVFRVLFLPFNNEGIEISEEMVSIMEGLFELIRKESEGDNSAALLHHYLSAFMTHIIRLSNQTGPRSAFNDPRIRKLFELINLNYKKEKAASFYSDMIGLSAKRINQILQEELGYTLGMLVSTYTVVEAKREINQNLKSMKEIAIELGFSSQSYFSRFFKKQTGMSPEEFRNNSIDIEDISKLC